MKKHRSKLMALALSAALGLSLTACGSPQKASEPESQSSVQPSEKATEKAPEQTPSEEPVTLRLFLVGRRFEA